MEQVNQSPLDNAAGPRRSTTFEPGSKFGEYTIVRRIGRGGQGSVFEVRDGLGLGWALKVSEEMALQDANAEMRFAREARCVAESLSELPRHSGVFVGEHYGVWDRRFYVKMKLLRGESLAQRLRRVGQLSIYEAVRIAERIAFAIGQAHEMGVLHRDLKPENVFLTERNEVVVLDWGCLQLIEAGQRQTTLRGVICTPGYAPIEQYLATTALNLTPAVDLYALGVMLYEALAGYHPFLNWSRAALNSPAAKRGAVSPEAQGSRSAPNAEREPCVNGSAGGTVATVKAMDDVFAAQTERHTVPEELLIHLRGIVTGGVTWQSAPDKVPLERPRGPFDTAATEPSKGLRSAASAHPAVLVQDPSSGWTHSRQVAHSTRTTPRPRGASPSASRSEIPAVAIAGAVANAEAPVERRPPRGDVPRRFSLVEVLAFQERVKPRAIEGLIPELGTLLLRLLAKRPTERPQDALDVAAQLRALLPQLVESPTEFAASTPEQNSRYLERSLLWIRLRQNSVRWTWAAAGVAVAGLTGAATYFGMNASRAASSDHVMHSAPATTTSSVSATAELARVPSVSTAVNAALPAVEAAHLSPPAAVVDSQSSLLAVIPQPSTAEASAQLTGPSPSRAKDKKRKRRLKDNASAASSAAASPAKPAAPVAEAAKPPCAEPCGVRGDAAEPAQNRRLQAKPKAALHRSSNKLWLE